MLESSVHTAHIPNRGLCTVLFYGRPRYFQHETFEKLHNYKQHYNVRDTKVSLSGYCAIVQTVICQ